MAAYAALVNLLNIMDQIQDHPRFSITFPQNQIQLLQQNLLFLLDFIESSPMHRGIEEEEEAQVLERQITSAVYAAEDVIETHVLHQIQPAAAAYAAEDVIDVDQILEPLLTFQTIIQNMEYVEEKIATLKDRKPIYYHASTSSETPLTSTENRSIVRFDYELIQLMDALTGYQSALQIASAAYATEDVIKTHVVDHIQAASVSLLDLETVIQDMDYVKEKVVSLKLPIKDVKPTYYPITSASTASSEKPLTTVGKSKMVGLDDYIYQLMDALTGRQSTLQIITIVGMGGIGKTTLAKHVYENSLILEHFDIRAWSTISQEYNINHIFSNLLSRETKSTLEPEDQQLALELYQSLIGRRYLIVLDDMWIIDVWDKIKNFFPDNNNGSRVVVTTRQSDMAACFGTLLLSLKLLDKDKSWELFCQKAFPQEGCCPSELVEIGMKIAKKCKGLALLIVVIGSLLRKSSRTREYWEDISNDINSVLNTGEEEEIKNLDILHWSYLLLPTHLKPCFLYLGIYPEDHVISVSRVVKLWVAEGFVKSNETIRLEAVARGYLEDLIDRNLLISRSWKWNGKTKTCEMHDLLRDLCLKIADKERFLCVIRGGDIQQGVVDKARRIVIPEGASLEQTSLDFDGLESALPLTRSLISYQYLQNIKFKLLRVLEMRFNLYYYMHDMLKQVNLRYICMHNHSRYDSNLRGLVSSISLLWNLQTLIIQHSQDRVIAPPEIWEMRQLRHLKISKVWLPDPPPLSSNQPAADADESFVQLNLQSLKTALDLSLNEDVCKRIVNIKKLAVEYDDLSGNLSFDFGRLHELEVLKCCFNEKPNLDDLLQSLTFPRSLRKFWF